MRIALMMIVATAAAAPAFAGADTHAASSATSLARPFATFSAPAKRRAASLATYRNLDVTKISVILTRVPHTVTKVVPVLTPGGKPVLSPTGVPVTRKVTVTTYTVVRTTSAKTTPKAEIFSSNGSLTPAAQRVAFRYLVPLAPRLQAFLSGLQTASYSLSAVSTAGAQATGNGFTQLFDYGTVKFTRLVPLTFRGHAGPKDNLLTVAFTNARLTTRGATSFSLEAATATSTIHYTSDFLNFAGDTSDGFKLDFTTPTSLALAAAPTATSVSGERSLQTTRAGLTGTFSAASVPEPAAWTLMIGGFAAVGMARRRSRLAQATA